MFTPEIDALVQQRSRTSRLVWLALTLSIPCYAVVAYVVVSSGSGVTPQTSDLLRNALAAMAVVNVLLAQGFWKFLISGTLSQTSDSVADLNKAVVEKLLNRYHVAVLIVLVINESIAIFGLVDSIVSGELDRILIYCGVALLLNFIRKPDPAAFLERVRSRAGR